MRASSIVRAARLLPLGLMLLMGTSGCAIFGGNDSEVSFFSEPPGARVIVDKKDTGFVTPCRLTLDREEHKVEIALPGYEPARLDLEPRMVHDVILWEDMALEFGSYHFPLWLNFGDTLTPVKFHANLEPGRVFVRLQRAVPQ